MRATIYRAQGEYLDVKADLLAAVAVGLQEHDVRSSFSDLPNYVPAQVHVCYAFGKPTHLELEKQVRRYGGRLLVVSPGYVRSSAYLDKVPYWSMLWDNSHGLGDPCIRNAPPDRWDALGIPLDPWRESGHYILLAGQVPTDGQVCHLDFFEWCRETARDISSRTDTPIRFRPHPLAREVTPDVPGTERSEIDFSDDLARAKAVVTYNSQSSSMAVIKGVPVFAFNRGSIAWPVAHHDLTHINCPVRYRRQEWANRLAYCQWTTDEIRQGKAWEHLRRGVR